MDAVVEVLSQHGIDGLSAGALAAKAGVSKASIFYHFDSVDDAVLEAFQRFAMGLEMMDPPDGTTLRDWLIGMGEASFGMGDDELDPSRAYFVFVSKALFDEALRMKVLGTVAEAAAAIRKITRRLDGKASDHLGDLIFMTADAMTIHLISFPERREEVLGAWGLFVDFIAPAKEKT